MELLIPELSLVLLIGPSSSGKSTFAQKHFLTTEILSSDFCRALVSDDETLQEATKDAFDILFTITRKRLARGKLTVIDATNVQQDARAPLLTMAQEYCFSPVAIVFDLCDAILTQRNHIRCDRNLPIHVIPQQTFLMRRSLEHPKSEGFHYIYRFETEDDVDQFVIWMGEWIKRQVTVRNPIVDAVLPDGSRINIVYGTDVSKRGSNFTIRKFSDVPTSVMELIEFGTLDYMMAAYLSFVLEEGMNMFVAGATASGKTTTMNAITTFIRPEKKIVSIEDTPELQVPHKNWIRETTRGGGKESTGAEVGMFDLLKAALRQRPDRIIVGEIRGEEGAIAFQAMQTGHGVMSTFHASNVEKLIQRLTGQPINIPKTYIDCLDVVLIQSAVRVAGRGMARRVMSINEIVGYDPTSESFSFIEVFRWNPATDTFDFPGFMNSYLLEEKIALRRGIPPFKKKIIYTELKRRAKILQRLHVERKLKNFYDVFAVLAEAQRQKLL